jgi:hypothetical protein
MRFLDKALGCDECHSAGRARHDLHVEVRHQLASDLVGHLPQRRDESANAGYAKRAPKS